MPRLQRKKKTYEVKSSESAGKESSLSERQDLPEESNIIGEKDFVSPKGKKYRIILTNEVDEYEQPKPASEKCVKKKK